MPEIDIERMCIVVIRTSGERTFEACKSLVLQQVPPSSVEVVNEQPFEVALRHCYEIGIASNVKWMITLDADVLLREKAIQNILLAAEKLPDKYLQLEGFLYDNLSETYRPVGYRIYRTKYLEKAVHFVPPPRDVIRPEYFTLLRMEEIGYPSSLVSQVFGIHDYEQFLRDVYRKSFVHANKHRKWLIRNMDTWKKKSAYDDDFRVVFRGLYDGLESMGVTSIDVRDFTQSAKYALRELSLTEKDTLDPSQIDFNFVENILDRAGSISIDLIFKNKPMTIQDIRNAIHKIGLKKFLSYIIGEYLCKASKLLAEKGKSFKETHY